MTPIDIRQLSELEWRQPTALKRAFELRSGDSVLGTLEFLKTLGTLAAARAGGRCWTFKRSGFLNPIVTAREEGSETDVATFRAKWTARSGTLELKGGAVTLRALNFWGSEWGVEDPTAGLLMRIHEKGVVHFSATYEVTEAGKRRPDLALLLCFTWYILVLMSEDSPAG
jgi:hypothetical protein